MGRIQKPEFKIKLEKLGSGDIQLGVFLNRKCFHRVFIDDKKIFIEIIERYIYISLFKICITIGFICD